MVGTFTDTNPPPDHAFYRVLVFATDNPAQEQMSSIDSGTGTEAFTADPATDALFQLPEYMADLIGTER